MSGYPFTTHQLDGFRSHTDPRAEAVLNQLFDHYKPDQVKTLFRHIQEYGNHPDVPGFLRQFMEEPGELPAWIDPRKLEKGRAVFSDFGREIVLVLLCRSLPMCYICAHGAHVLATTTRMIDIPKNPDYSRRLLETLQFVVNVSCHDITQPGGIGIISVRKVRLIHAAIRRFIHEKMEWDTARLGAPINQEDQLVTMSAFGMEVVKALAKMGIHLDREDRDAWCHLWETTGFLLGIEEPLLPRDYDSCREMSERILASQARRSDDGRRLCLSCVDFLSGLLPHRLLVPFSLAVFKYLNDEAHRETMGYNTRHRFWDWLMPRLMKSTLGIDQRMEKRSPLLKFLIRTINGWLIKGLLKITMKNGKFFYLPDSLKP